MSGSTLPILTEPSPDSWCSWNPAGVWMETTPSASDQVISLEDVIGLPSHSNFACEISAGTSKTLETESFSEYTSSGSRNPWPGSLDGDISHILDFCWSNKKTPDSHARFEESIELEGRHHSSKQALSVKAGVTMHGRRTAQLQPSSSTGIFDLNFDALMAYEDQSSTTSPGSHGTKARTLVQQGFQKSPKTKRRTKQKPGRKPSHLTSILRLFTPTDTRGVWRKDSLRTKVVRSFKGYIRDICKLDSDETTVDELATLRMFHQCKVRPKLHHIDHPDAFGLRKNIVQLYAEAKRKFFEMSYTGPKNDDKRNGIESRLSRCKSYNNTYCEHYFEEESIRTAFSRYVELIFLSSPLENLCERFKGRCCRPPEQHAEECISKWEALKEIILSDEFLRRSAE